MLAKPSNKKGPPMRLLIIILLVGLPAAASAWYMDPPEENARMHFFACGWLLGQHDPTFHSNCADVEAIAHHHGFKF